MMRTAILLFGFSLAGVSLTLGGCGNRGPLYLPPPESVTPKQDAPERQDAKRQDSPAASRPSNPPSSP